MSDNIFDQQMKDLLGIEDSDAETAIRDIEPLAPVIFEAKESKESEAITSQDLKDDYEFVRSNLYALIGRTNAAIDLIMKVINMTEGSGKSIDSLSSLVEKSNNLSKDLIDLHKKLERTESKSKTGNVAPQVKNVQNNVYLNNQKELEEAKNILDQLEDE